MKFLFTGDTHSWHWISERLLLLHRKGYKPADTALIILGDTGLNYWLDETEYEAKEFINDFGYTIYCVRGNHEERPENISTMIRAWDNEVQGWIMYEEVAPLIRYFLDGEVYKINGQRTLIIGGAYSIDKSYRIAAGFKWFPQEQLSQEEMENIENRYKGQVFDLILSHTCPYSWRPTDLFLEGFDQTFVDNSMELWMNEFKDMIDYDVWAFGHYHDDRLVRPGVVMLYEEIINLDDIHNPNLMKGPQYDYE